MEWSISSLTFSGSIPEAITLAKNQKKLFVVYISGEDEESVRLDESLWTDLRVAECITKYCVLLHIPEGSSDATNFSAIYPQTSCPCITAVGYTGALVWQNDESVSPENLVSSIEKAWLSLHIQETTATVLTAALASKNNDQSLTGVSTPTSAPHEPGESSSSTSLSPSEEHSKASESSLMAPSTLLDQEIDGDNASEEFPEQKDIKMDENDQSVSLIEAVEVRELSGDPASVDQDNKVSNRDDISLSDNNMQESDSGTNLTNQEIKRDLNEASVLTENRDLSSSVSEETSSELLLNIRLPNGTNLQDKFPKIDALRLLKDYVDRNMVDFKGSYDLAIPYPRKVFKEQDLDKSLEEHGIINRQGFIVVPHQRTSYRVERGSSSAPNFAANTDSSTGRIGGYFSYVRYMLSYVNPFSYLGGAAASSTPTHESSSVIQQNSPNSRQGFVNPTNSTSQGNERNIRRRTSRIGGNIHTLKDEEDDVQDDKNTFWNGNSTEFGGSDNSR